MYFIVQSRIIFVLEYFITTCNKYFVMHYDYNKRSLTATDVQYVLNVYVSYI